VMKGSVNTASSRTVLYQLIGAPHSTSMMPWRMAENSRVWSPCTSEEPGYCLMLMRPLVRSRTRVRKISPPLPQANAGGTTVDILYSALYAPWAWAKRGRPTAATPAAASERRRTVRRVLMGIAPWLAGGSVTQASRQPERDLGDEQDEQGGGDERDDQPADPGHRLVDTHPGEAAGDHQVHRHR